MIFLSSTSKHEVIWGSFLVHSEWMLDSGVVTITEGDIFPRYWIVTPHCNTSARSVQSPTQCTFYSMAYFDNDLKELFEMHQKSSQSRGGLLEINCELFWSFLLDLGVLECFFMYQVCTGDHDICIHFTTKRIQQYYYRVCTRSFGVFELPISGSPVFSSIAHR